MKYTKRARSIVAATLLVAITVSGCTTKKPEPINGSSIATLADDQNDIQVQTTELDFTQTSQESKELSLDELLSLTLEYSGADSIQYALWEDGDITLEGQNARTGRRDAHQLTEESLYGIGSICKIYVTTAMMQLVEENKVSLDEKVTTYLPGFKMADDRYKQITVRMLLNHSAGFMGNNDDNAILFDDSDLISYDTILQKLETERLANDPGAFSTYSNTGFTLAEKVIEAVSGQDFPTYIREHVLTPLELTNTYAPNEEFDTDRREKTWYWTHMDTPMPMECVNQIGGVGGYYSTASDVAALGGALTKAGFLSETSLDAMEAPEYRNGIWPEEEPDRFGFGLGWDNVNSYPFCQSKIQALSKNGDTLVYHSALIVLPEYQMSAAVLLCGGTSDYAQLGAIHILTDALEKREIKVDQSAPELLQSDPDICPDEIKSYAGWYGSSMIRLKLEFDENVLLLTNIEAGVTKRFVYCQDGYFHEEMGEPWMLRIEKAEGGRVYLYQKNIDMFGELGVLPWSLYTAVRLDDNVVSDEVQKNWNEAYYASLPVNEKYTSMSYASVSPHEGMSEQAAVSTKVPGYVDTIQIIDETHAKFASALPEMYGRDGTDLVLEEEDGTVYIKANAKVSIPEKYVQPLLTEDRFDITIGKNGYAKWFRTGSQAGKKITVDLPESAGFYVYNAEGAITASSVMWGDTEAELSENGYLVFVGTSDAVFHITVTQE